jgi:hypothetical protein
MFKKSREQNKQKFRLRSSSEAGQPEFEQQWAKNGEPGLGVRDQGSEGIR